MKMTGCLELNSQRGFIIPGGLGNCGQSRLCELASQNARHQDIGIIIGAVQPTNLKVLIGSSLCEDRNERSLSSLRTLRDYLGFQVPVYGNYHLSGDIYVGE